MVEQEGGGNMWQRLLMSWWVGRRERERERRWEKGGEEKREGGREGKDREWGEEGAMDKLT
jgi:hypothetical protein